MTLKMEDPVSRPQAADRPVCGVHLQAGFRDGRGVSETGCDLSRLLQGPQRTSSPTNGQSKFFFLRVKLYMFIV